MTTKIYDKNELVPKNIIDDIVFSIDFNYVLACALRDNDIISLSCITCKNYDRDIKWKNHKRLFSENYHLSLDILRMYLLKNNTKIIKMNILSEDAVYKIDKNIIIYYPNSKYLLKLQKCYSVVDITKYIS